MRKPNCETLPLRHFRWARMARCCGDGWWKAANNGELLLTTFLTHFFGGVALCILKRVAGATVSSQNSYLFICVSAYRNRGR